MRGSLGASDTAFARARALGFLAIAAAALAGCAHAAPRHPPERRPPPHVLAVGIDQVTLRTTAWVELHAWLAAQGTYKQALAADDDRDEQLGRTTRALEACDDERCARAAVDGTPFARAYLATLPGFLARDWSERAATARAGIELARAALGPEVEALVARLAQDLAIDWPTPPPVVDIVSDAPEPGREAPIRVLLSARSSCFARSRAESERMHDARVVDCVLTVSAWEPTHSSVLRQSAASVMPEAMRWPAEEWPSRMRGASVGDIARPYAATLADARKAVARPGP